MKEEIRKNTQNRKAVVLRIARFLSDRDSAGSDFGSFSEFDINLNWNEKDKTFS